MVLVVLPKFVYLISGSAAELLVSQALARIDSALRPHTQASYMAKFKLFLDVAAWFQL